MSWCSGDSSGNLWVFGGETFDVSNKPHYLNDLWKLDSRSGNWTWVGGSSAQDSAGVYGTMGLEAASNAPGARQHPRIIGGLQSPGLFGGYGYDAAGKLGYLNDLWTLNTATGDLDMEIRHVAGQSDRDLRNKGCRFRGESPQVLTTLPHGRRPEPKIWVFGGFSAQRGGAMTFGFTIWPAELGPGLPVPRPAMRVASMARWVWQHRTMFPGSRSEGWR